MCLILGLSIGFFLGIIGMGVLFSSRSAGFMERKIREDSRMGRVYKWFYTERSSKEDFPVSIFEEWKKET